MEKLKEYKYIIGIILLVLGFGFYWYEVRPSQIRKKCYEVAVEEAKNSLKTKVELDSIEYREAAEKDLYLKDDYKSYYERCLSKRGL